MNSYELLYSPFNNLTIVGKWLLADPEIWMVISPRAGVDSGYKLLASAAWYGGWDLNPTLSGDVSRNFPLFLFSDQGYGTLIALGLEE
jgi:hypothetical protein